VRIGVAMKPSRIDRPFRISAFGCLLAFALSAHAPAVQARTEAAPPNMGAAAYTKADLDLAEKVQSALQTDPYINDTHIVVSVDKGTVYLRGFVMGAWDLLDAIRIAHRVAGGNRVIDELSVQLGGRK
jgi:osmotically-inducible protein OsmY